MDTFRQQLLTANESLYEASRSIRILSHISWPLSVRDRFFATGESQIPVIEYAPFDPAPVFERTIAARKKFVFDDHVNQWMNGIADELDTAAKMLATCGTPEFFQHSSVLYGAPSDSLADSENTPLDLATMFQDNFADFKDLNLGPAPLANVTADSLALTMNQASTAFFGDDTPAIQVVEELSANALAGPNRIRIRRDAQFTERDVAQLINHEAHIHVGTSLNGQRQPVLKILGAAHPGTTRTQEGLAVFAEFITGSMDLDRFRRLADRVIAIQMAIDGADFIEVYRFFLIQTEGDKVQSFESTRRVFRGGTTTGGAPFTKDIVYLDGLLRVHNFLRTIVAHGRADCIRLLFCGKLDLEELPVIGEFYKLGLCESPKFIPPWASDIRFLLCYLSYSAFLNKIDLTKVRQRYRTILDALPKIESA